MGIKTEDFIPSIPPKEITSHVDWVREAGCNPEMDQGREAALYDLEG